MTELVNDELELGTDGCVRWDAVHRLGRSYRRSSGGDHGFCVIHVDPAEEVTRWGDIRFAPDGVGVFSPAFDVTPNELISAIVTERGIMRPPFGPALREVSGAEGEKA